MRSTCSAHLRLGAENMQSDINSDWPHVRYTPTFVMIVQMMSALQVQCAFCSGVLSHWEAGDDPSKEHRRHFPSCPLHFNIPVGNIPLGESADGTQQYQSAHRNVTLRELRPFSGPERSVVSEGRMTKQDDMSELGIQTHHGPRHPKYSTVESRLRTYTDWPSNMCQTPQQLAQAGFYYVGKT